MCANSKENKKFNRREDINIEINILKTQRSLLEERIKLIELKVEGFEIMLKKELED